MKFEKVQVRLIYEAAAGSSQLEPNQVHQIHQIQKVLLELNFSQFFILRMNPLADENGLIVFKIIAKKRETTLKIYFSIVI